MTTAGRKGSSHHSSAEPDAGPMTEHTWQPGDRTPSTFSGDPNRAGSGPKDGLHLSLVLIWSREESSRVGEVLLVPPHPSERVWRFGRGQEAGVNDLLAFYRQRPGLLERSGPPFSPRISRSQLEVQLVGAEVLSVQNVGRCPLLHFPAGSEPQVEAEPVSQCLVRPGDVLELKNEMLLLCTLRTGTLPALPEIGTSRSRSENAALADRDSTGLPRALHGFLGTGYGFGSADAFGMVGESPAMWELRRIVWQVGHQQAHVLILGASGTGKELVARAIHGVSRHRSREMVSRNAATFPEGLIDAELFGNIKNYPNPGMPERNGLVGQANGSSLFLDEFAELPVPLQSHLLRVMDDGEYQRLGESTPQHATFRLIAATNRTERHLKHDIRARLKSRIRVPDLNQRREDIPFLIRHLLRRLAKQDPDIARRGFKGESVEGEPRLTPELVRILVQHRYRTHVRELDALLLTAVMESRGRYFDVSETLFRELAESSGGGSSLFVPNLEQASASGGAPASAVMHETADRVGSVTAGGSSGPGRERADGRRADRSSGGIESTAADTGRAASFAPKAGTATLEQAPATPFNSSEQLQGEGGWKTFLLAQFQQLLVEQPHESPDYDRLQVLGERLKASWVSHIHAQEQERLLATARRLNCNRDVVRRLLEKKA